MESQDDQLMSFFDESAQQIQDTENNVQNIEFKENKPVVVKEIKNQCFKCKEQSGHFLYRIGQPICNPCLDSKLKQRVKYLIKEKINIKLQDKVLIACSGGMNSIFLAHTVGINLKNQKKKAFQAELLYIDENSIYQDDNKEHIQKIQQISQLCELPFSTIKIEDIYGDSKQLHTILEQLKPIGSCREDLLKHFKTHLIFQFALKNNFNKVFLALNGQRLSSKLLSQFVKGKGINVYNNVQFSEEILYENQALSLCRPCREFNNREVQQYMKINNLLNFVIIRASYLCQQDPKNLRYPSNGNLDFLMEDFIDKLQVNFESSMYSVINSTEKISMKQDVKNLKICPICLGFIDQIYNLLEIKSFDGNQEQFSENAKNFNQQKDVINTNICFGCIRMLENPDIAEYNLDKIFMNMPTCIKQQL